MEKNRPTRGSELRSLRLTAGLSLEQAAKLAGTSAGYLRAVEQERIYVSSTFVTKTVRLYLSALLARLR